MQAKGEKSTSWKGGITHNAKGYTLVYAPDHEHSYDSGYVREHILVMTKHLGRPLLKNETVHHKNGIKTDNRIENLELWASSHPHGQRVEDLVKHAWEIIKLYDPDHKHV
jgi:hypothetical protein